MWHVCISTLLDIKQNGSKKSEKLKSKEVREKYAKMREFSQSCIKSQRQKVVWRNEKQEEREAQIASQREATRWWWESQEEAQCENIREVKWIRQQLDRNWETAEQGQEWIVVSRKRIFFM